MAAPNIQKRCTKCNSLKPLTDFHRNRLHASGRSTHCKKCVDDRRKARKSDPDLLCPVIDLPGEEWRSVMGFESDYAVSNLGRVKRISAARRTFAGKLLTPGLTSGGTGYYTVSFRVNKRPRSFYVHRLVAAAFLGTCPTSFEVNYKNGDSGDNRVNNLEYVSHGDNMRHAAHVLKRTYRKLGDTEVRDVRDEYAKGGITFKTLAERYGMHPSHISKVVKGRIRRFV